MKLSLVALVVFAEFAVAKWDCQVGYLYCGRNVY
jgi:hypothetical protein